MASVLTGLWDASWSLAAGRGGLLHREEEAHDGRCSEAETEQTVSTMAPRRYDFVFFCFIFLPAYLHFPIRAVSKFTITNIFKSSENEQLPAGEKDGHGGQSAPVFFKLQDVMDDFCRGTWRYFLFKIYHDIRMVLSHAIRVPGENLVRASRKHYSIPYNRLRVRRASAILISILFYNIPNHSNSRKYLYGSSRQNTNLPSGQTNLT